MSKNDWFNDPLPSNQKKLEKARRDTLRSVSALAPPLLELLWDWSKGILGVAFAIACVGTVGVLVLAFAKHMGVL